MFRVLVMAEPSADVAAKVSTEGSQYCSLETISPVPVRPEIFTDFYVLLKLRKGWLRHITPLYNRIGQKYPPFI